MGIILHITGRDDWERAMAVGSYEPDSLRSQGFIHCSRPDQVVAVANALFRGRKNLIVLCIDTDRIPHEIRYENLDDGRELFPHVYGPVIPDAVVRVVDFVPEPNGTFLLPTALKEDRGRRK